MNDKSFFRHLGQKTVKGQATRANRRRLFLEPLETRWLLAGDCDIDLDGSLLTIDCDGDDNHIYVEGTGTPGEVEIVAEDGESLNGPTTATGVTDIEIEMNDGDDIVGVFEIDISGDLEVDGGEDSNYNIVANSEILGDVTIENDDTDHASPIPSPGIRGS